jgi:hypothetical protein
LKELFERFELALDLDLGSSGSPILVGREALLADRIAAVIDLLSPSSSSASATIFRRLAFRERPECLSRFGWSPTQDKYVTSIYRNKECGLPYSVPPLFAWRIFLTRARVPAYWWLKAAQYVKKSRVLEGVHTLSSYLFFSRLKPRPGGTRKYFIVMLNQILSFLQFHLCLPKVLFFSFLA